MELKMKAKQYILLLFFALLSLQNFATHIVGGEIYYDCLGSNNYRITLKLYRDCFNGQVGYDDPASVFIFDNAGNYIDSIQMAFPGSDTLPFPLTNPCLVPPTNICYEETFYVGYVNLPPLAGGYNLTYQRCCRNGTILNLVNPGNVGSTYMIHVPDPGSAACNNSSRFNNFPPIFLCTGVPLNFDHSATDPDGDSLHYTLCDPYNGLDVSPSCPILGPQSPGGCGTMATAPPIPFVPWLAPYNGAYPMSSSPALAVNPVTGLMTGTPNLVGQWVIGVCCEEYRNGVLLNVNKRDFQFNVVNCGIPVASIPTQQTFCLGSPSIFSQNSINANTYHWDFGDLGLTNDTSILFGPSWTYADTGTYIVTLIVNPNTVCTDTASLPVTVHPLPIMTSITGDSICSGQTVSIPLSSDTASTYTWLAINNPNTTGESTTQQTGSPLSNTITNNASSDQSVTYHVTPTSVPGGCAGTPQTVTVLVHPAPTMTNPSSANICTGVGLNIPLTSSVPATYSWVATDNDSTTGEDIAAHTGTPLSDIINNNANSTQQVIYSVTPTSTAYGCVGNPQTITVSVVPMPVMATLPAVAVCTGIPMNVALTSNVASTYSWVATDNTNTTGESTTTQTDSIIHDLIINPTAVDQNVVYSITPTSSVAGCVGTPFVLTATIYHGITADFDFVKVPCVNQVTFADSSAAVPVSWLWNFDDGGSSSVQNPAHVFDSTGAYNVQLITANANGCKDTVVVQVDFTQLPQVTISSNTAICIGNSTQLQATGGFAYSWSPAVHLSDTTVSNPVANPDTTTTYSVAISTVDNFGDTCMQTLSTTVTSFDPALYSISASADYDTIVEGTSTTLHAITDTSLVVNWNPSTGMSNPNSFNPSVSPSTTTTYVASILDSAGCPKMDSIRIFVVSNKCDPESVFVPNTFTPNGDGQNDVLYVRGNEIKELYFAIYNRRGELIFETDNKATGWDGTFNGKKADPDVFAYYVKATCFNESSMIKKGNVTIIR
jgi:gliding motility-associated-like protein